MKTRLVMITALIATVALLPATAGANPLGPPQVEPADLTIQVEHAGTSPATVAQNSQISFGFNLGSPVAIKDTLFLIDQNDAIYRQTRKGDIQKVFDATTEAPDGLALDNRQRVLNIAPGPANDRMYVVLTSGTEPANVPVYRMPPPLPDVCCVPGAPIPVDDLYRLGPLPIWLGAVFGTTRTEYQVVYDVKVKGNKLNDPRALVAFETQSGPTHNGGGAVTLPDGRLALALGDGLPFGAEGRAAAQDPASHLSSILLVSPDGSIEVAAKGVRNVQHMEISPDGTTVLFGDIGGVTAEEVNAVGVAELTDTSETENFGWGRNPDGLARAAAKVLDHLDEHCRRFIALSPLMFIATSDGARADVSPRGDAPGFVQPEGDRALLIPDRPGNNRIDGLLNICASPRVGLVFVIPGVRETLRVNGPAEIRDDEDLRARFPVRGALPLTVLRVETEEVYMHCAKAFLRSRAWMPEHWPDASGLASYSEVMRDHAGDTGPLESEADMIARFDKILY